MKICKKCGAELTRGIAIPHNYETYARCIAPCITIWTHPVPIIDVYKCKQCGHSETIN